MSILDDFFDYDNSFSMITDPIPILQQPISKTVTTNAYLTGIDKPIYAISKGQKLNNFGEELNKKILEEIQANSSKKENPKNKVDNIMSKLSDVNINFSIYVIESMDELLNKPDDIEWNDYIKNVFMKEKQKLVYIGVLILMILLLILWLS